MWQFYRFRLHQGPATSFKHLGNETAISSTIVCKGNGLFPWLASRPSGLDPAFAQRIKDWCGEVCQSRLPRRKGSLRANSSRRTTRDTAHLRFALNIILWLLVVQAKQVRLCVSLPLRLSRLDAKPCTCAEATMTKYQKRISGPLLDRMGIHKFIPRRVTLQTPPGGAGARFQLAPSQCSHIINWNDGNTAKLVWAKTNLGIVKDFPGSRHIWWGIGDRRGCRGHRRCRRWSLFGSCLYCWYAVEEHKDNQDYAEEWGNNEWQFITKRVL